MTIGAVWTAGLTTGLAVASLLGPFLAPTTRHERRGLEAWRDGDYAESMAEYTAAREGARDPEAIDFNLGAAAYRTGDMEAALQKFSAADRSPLPPPGAAEYNAGNALFRAGQLKDALTAYRAALLADPGDEDARYNYELTLTRLEQSPPDSSGQQNQDQKNQQDEKDQQQGDRQQQGNQDQAQNSEGDRKETPQDQQGGGESDRPEEQKESENAPPQGGQSADEEKNEQPPNPAGEEDADSSPDEKGARQNARLLTKQEAERLLNAVTPEERELLEARLRSASRKKAEKDW